MGVFTEQVQGLVSEAQIKRKQKEEKEAEKRYLQELEQKLYYLFIDTFMENINAKKTYIFLTSYDTKCELLRHITKNTKIEKQDYFFYLLDLKYNKILNNVKQNFLQKQKEEEKEQKRKLEEYYLKRLQLGPHL